MKTYAVLLAASTVAAIAACHTPGTPPPPPHTAFDASQFPPGAGWFCYSPLEGSDPTPCDRDEATCTAKRKKDVNAKSDCTKYDVAYCYSTNDPAKPIKACFHEERECKNGSNVKPPAGEPSDCGQVK